VGETFAVVRQYSLAERYLDRAILLAPELPVPYLFKAELYVVWQGDTARARAVLREALGKMPLSDLVGEMGRPSSVSALLQTGNDSLARDLERLTPDAFDGDTALYYHAKTELHYTREDQRRARVYADSGRIALEAKLRDRPDEAFLRARLGYANAVLGRKADAIREGRRAVELRPVSRDALGGTFSTANLARIYTMAGEPDAAIDLIEELLSVPSWSSVHELRVDPAWDPLRGHPRFQRIIGR
jgi:tetratricopeptide (TPR) repeat protein